MSSESGKEIRRHTSGRGSTLVFFQAPDSEETIAEICHYLPRAARCRLHSDLTHLAFEVDGFDGFIKAAAAKGYPLTDGPHGTKPGRMAFIDGPEGYEIELIEKKR